MHNHLEMLPPSNPKSSDNSKVQLDLPNPNDINNVTDSRLVVFVPNKKIQGPNWKKEMKMKLQLPPKNRSSSLALAPTANRRMTLTLDEAIEYELKHGRKVDPSMDRKQLRRTISNRLSAQRSRMKRSLYINGMEKTVKDLEDMILALTPQVESYKEKRKELLLQNDSLQKLIQIRSSESRVSEMLLEQKQLEISRLKELAETVNFSPHDPNYSQEQIQDPRFTQSSFQPYSLEFYRNSLQKLGSNQFNQEQVPSSSRVQSEPQISPNFGSEQPEKDKQSGFMTELPVEVSAQDKSQEEEDAEIDQYLNFEAINLDPASVLN